MSAYYGTFSVFWALVSRYKGRPNYLCERCGIEITGADEYYRLNNGSTANVRRRCKSCQEALALIPGPQPIQEAKERPSRVTIGDRRRRKIELR